MPVFARGMTINENFNPYLPKSTRTYWVECGKALDKFNTYVANDPRIDVTMLPLFDGVSQIKWKVEQALLLEGGHAVHGNVAKGNRFLSLGFE